MSRKKSWALIAWAPYSRRGEVYARLLEGKLHRIYYPRFRARCYTPFRYAMQMINTLQTLFKERPRAVYVQNPPFVCGLVVYFYCRITGTPFVFDHHSAVFAPEWRWALPVQKFLARRAVTNIVTNQHLADIVQSWDAHALIMRDPFLALPQGEAFPIKPGFSVAFVSSFAPDEPFDAVLEAATQLSAMHFYITGDTSRKPKSYFNCLPTNVTCTGFLPDAQYIGLLGTVDAIMALTTRNHTLQRGGCEAVSVGQPLITSDWSFLQEFFSKGTIHVKNTADGIRDGVIAMQKEQGRLKAEMAMFRDTTRHEWNIQFSQLGELVEQAIRRCDD